LASYLVEQRPKEIGIRKVLGASVPKICLMLSREFFRWVVVANLLAWPTAYYLTGHWLQNFAQRVGIAPGIYILSGVSSFIAALAAIGYQSVKTAFRNPVKALRYE